MTPSIDAVQSALDESTGTAESPSCGNDADFAAEWGRAHGKEKNVATLIDDDEFAAVIDVAVQRVNADLAQNERIRRHILAAEPFTVDNEMMTPSLKVRRHKVRELYGARLEALY